MGYGRVWSVWWTLGLGVVVGMALMLGAPSQVAAAGDDNPYEGFSGVCHGQCRAALGQGCFENPDTRQCGKREEQWEFHACPGTPPWAPPVKQVFVTSTAYTGNLGGLAGADAKCQARATAAGLGGTFKAWLSAAGPGNSAFARLSHASVPYVRVDDVQVAANFTDLVKGTLAAPITIDEFGHPFSGTFVVWTGTLPDGHSAAEDCHGWSTERGDDYVDAIGWVGRLGLADPRWTDEQSVHCTIKSPIALSSSECEGTTSGQRGGRAWERFPRPGRNITAEDPAVTPALTHRTQCARNHRVERRSPLPATPAPASPADRALVQAGSTMPWVPLSTARARRVGASP